MTSRSPYRSCVSSRERGCVGDPVQLSPSAPVSLDGAQADVGYWHLRLRLRRQIDRSERPSARRAGRRQPQAQRRRERRRRPEPPGACRFGNHTRRDPGLQAIIGVDPHKRVLDAVALDERGGVLERWPISPTVSPSTVTRAPLTRWQTTRTARQRPQWASHDGAPSLPAAGPCVSRPWPRPYSRSWPGQPIRRQPSRRCRSWRASQASRHRRASWQRSPRHRSW